MVTPGAGAARPTRPRSVDRAFWCWVAAVAVVVGCQLATIPRYGPIQVFHAGGFAVVNLLAGFGVRAGLRGARWVLACFAALLVLPQLAVVFEPHVVLSAPGATPPLIAGLFVAAVLAAAAVVFAFRSASSAYIRAMSAFRAARHAS